MNGDREQQPVELVNPDGEPIGTATVAQAHTAPGQLHRAFSVLLFDPSGQTLVQRRAATKTRFPSAWANACCGHPAPNEPPTDAATRRLAEELGISDVALTEAGVYTYRATDSATGRVEHEFDHVIIGRTPAGLMLSPDPGEVAETRWAPVRQLQAEINTRSGAEFAPWLLGVLYVAYSRLRDIGLN